MNGVCQIYDDRLFYHKEFISTVLHVYLLILR